MRDGEVRRNTGTLQKVLEVLEYEFNAPDALRASGLSTALAFWSSWVRKVREECNIFFRIEYATRSPPARSFM